MTQEMPTPPVEQHPARPLFSVVIPTRNRPKLLERAIASVLMQQNVKVEIIIVDDGTDATLAPQLDDIASSLAGHGQIVHLPRKSKGHGPSFALNFGAALASGSYLCFLDDDDEWTDPAHLEQASATISAAPQIPDLLLYQQTAFHADGTRREGPIWIEDLCPYVRENIPAIGIDSYPITASELMRSPGFSHVNTLIVSKQLFDNVGGFDSSIRYENDRDFYLRVVDIANYIVYNTITVARHNIPSVIQATSASSIVTDIDKALYQTRLGIKAMIMARTPSIKLHAQRHRSYVLKKLSVILHKNGKSREALQFALEALSLGFTFKWFLYTGYITMFALFRNIFRRPTNAENT
jgi:glycosyltransferase involved in cell wall biosynthesis